MNASSSCSLSSPSSSSSSFSSYPDGRGGGSIQCIPRILRCFGVHPWRGSEFDEIGEEQKGKPCTSAASLVCGPSAPGIVARLMGLESLPVPQTQLARRTRLGSPQKRCFSDYQELEDEQYFILSFEHGPLCSRRGRSRGTNKDNEEIICRRSSDSGPDARSNGNLLGPVRNSRRKPRKRREKNLKYDGDNEDESDNSSPNSVLQFTKFSPENQQISPGEFPRPANSAFKAETTIGAREKIIATARNSNNIRRFSAVKQDESGELSEPESAESIRVGHRRQVEEIRREIASEILGFLLDELLISFR